MRTNLEGKSQQLEEILSKRRDSTEISNKICQGFVAEVVGLLLSDFRRRFQVESIKRGSAEKSWRERLV